MQDIYTGIIEDQFVFPEDAIKINEVCTINNLTMAPKKEKKKTNSKKKIKKIKKFCFLDYIQNNSSFQDCLFKGIKVVENEFVKVNEEQNLDKKKLQKYQQEILKRIRLQQKRQNNQNKQNQSFGIQEFFNYY